jgi:hypothetical protein
MTQLRKSIIITAIILISYCNTYTIEVNDANHNKQNINSNDLMIQSFIPLDIKNIDKSNLCDEALNQFLIAFNPLTQAIRICNLFAAMRYVILTTAHSPMDILHTLHAVSIKNYKSLIAFACLTQSLLIGKFHLETKEYNQQRNALYKYFHTTIKKTIDLSAQITAEFILCIAFGTHSMFPLLILCNFINEDPIIK